MNPRRCIAPEDLRRAQRQRIGLVISLIVLAASLIGTALLIGAQLHFHETQTQAQGDP